MSLVPRPRMHPKLLALLRDTVQTVNVPLLDLYDLLMRKEQTMPNLENATTVRKAKRGYRRLGMTIKVAEWELIAAMAEREDRTPDQQALHMLRQLLKELQVAAIKGAYTEAVERRLEEEGGQPEDAVDPHGFTLGEVSRTE